MGVEVLPEQPRDAAEYVDQALERCGSAGRFQYKYLAMVGLCWGYAATLPYLSIFAGKALEVRQVSQTGVVGPTSPLNCSLPRNQWEYANAAETYLAAFDLVCENAPLAPLLSTFYFFGCMVGAALCGWLADVYGRRLIVVVGLLLQTLGLLWQAAALDYTQFAAAHFLSGLGTSGFLLISYVWASEVLGKELRSVLAWFPNVVWSVGQMLLSILAWAVPDWRQLLLVEALLGCFFALLVCFHESPKWLAAQGQYKEAHAVLCACAKANGKRTPPMPPATLVNRGDCSLARPGELDSAPAPQLLDRRFRVRLLIMCFAWFATSMGYYGLSLNAVSLPLDIYTANLVTGASIIPGYLLSGVFLDRPYCGRRNTAVGAYLFAGGCLLLSCIGGPVELIVLYYSANSAMSLIFAVIFVWSSELYPTSISGKALGWHSFCGRMGAMLAPLVPTLASEEHPNIPLAIFAVACLISALLTIFIPETMGATTVSADSLRTALSCEDSTKHNGTAVA